MRTSCLTSSVLVAVLLSACASPSKPPPLPPEPVVEDPHSFSRPDLAVVRNIDLDLTVDFDARVIEGRARLDIENLHNALEVILDTKDLDVHSVARVNRDGAESVASWTLGERQNELGRALTIEIREDTVQVVVDYETSPDAAALQWLSPEQTDSGDQPFLFTQSQAILARTWVPCQDSPGVRITYSATVRVPRGLTALMSARRIETSEPGVFQFVMPQRIPSYLLALAVGKVEFRELGPRTGVWAEPGIVESAASEFADTEAMMEAAERLYGPYRWERYDILVLPPSFPWGGMENPRVTFATPTIIAGDRSLVALIAHELAHSWSGNLVTNAVWGDFWLNEGFTVYFEHRIMEELYGREYDELLASLAYEELLDEMESLPARDRRLRLRLIGRDPEAAMTAIPYEKGYFFLRTCEEVFGREAWDAFLRRYFDEFAFGTMTSARFVALLRDRLIQGDPEIEERLRVEEWVWGGEIPPGAALPSPGAFATIDAAAAAFDGGAGPAELGADDWNTHEWLRFLRHIERPLENDRAAALDEAFGLTETGNAEIASEWFGLAIESGYAPARPRLEEFLLEVGRLKLIRPLWTRLLTGSDEDAAFARQVWQRARPGYHPIAAQNLDALLGE